jgi:hypothetical protein
MDPVRIALIAALTVAVACRSDKAPEPSAAPAATSQSLPAPRPPMPDEPPRFGWQTPLSVPVDDLGEDHGRQIRTRYRLDVCPNADGTLSLTRRELKIVTINGVAPSIEVAKKAEAAVDLPPMTVDHRGAFIKDEAWVAWRLADLWQNWVELWLHVDPKRGNPQDVSEQNIGDGARTVVTFTGLTDDHRARFEARRDLSKNEVWQMTKDVMLKRGLTDVEVAKMTKAAHEEMDVETDWPELRPWYAHSRKTVQFSKEGAEHDLIEDRQYRFDWHASGREKPTCP